MRDPPTRARSRAARSTANLSTSVTSASSASSDAHRERGRELVFVVEDLDVQRQRVGQRRGCGRHDRHRAELAHRARVAEDHAVEQAPFDVGQRDAPERLPAARAEHGRRFLLLVPCACISGISSRATNGNVTNIVASTMPGTAKITLRSCSASHGAEPALQAEDQHVDQPGDHRRHRERQVDQRDQHALAGKVELGDRPRRRDAEHEVERHRDRRGEQRQPDRRQRVGLGDRREVDAEALLQRLDEARTASGTNRNR